MPTYDWTVQGDDHGSRRRRTHKIIGLVVLAFFGVVAVVYAVDALGGNVPKNYRTSVDCQVDTVGSQSTVTINGTIYGDATNYSVTVEVLDAASQQKIGGQTFEVRGETTFGGTALAQAPVGTAGIECKVSKVV